MVGSDLSNFSLPDMNNFIVLSTLDKCMKSFISSFGFNNDGFGIKWPPEGWYAIKQIKLILSLLPNFLQDIFNIIIIFFYHTLKSLLIAKVKG